MIKKTNNNKKNAIHIKITQKLVQHMYMLKDFSEIQNNFVFASCYTKYIIMF